MHTMVCSFSWIRHGGLILPRASTSSCWLRVIPDRIFWYSMKHLYAASARPPPLHKLAYRYFPPISNLGWTHPTSYCWIGKITQRRLDRKIQAIPCLTRIYLPLPWKKNQRLCFQFLLRKKIPRCHNLLKKVVWLRHHPCLKWEIFF